jgi:hypothetical protein
VSSFPKIPILCHPSSFSSSELIKQAVAGLEYGSECYCGTLADIENTLVSGECKMACSGDSSQVCGGPNAINIYIDASNVPATVALPSGWTTYGVVTEGDNGRLLPVQLYSSNENTVEKCANECAAAGYTISGTEYSSECFCGNAFVAVSTFSDHPIRSLMVPGRWWWSARR